MALSVHGGQRSAGAGYDTCLGLRAATSSSSSSSSSSELAEAGL
jgi:hypothetical protein